MNSWSTSKERKLVLFISALLLGFIIVLIITHLRNVDNDSTSKQVPFNWEDHTFVITASDSKIISQWRASLNKKASDTLVNKLNEIRELSPFGRDLNESLSFSGGLSEICYTEECLDEALMLLKIVNFSIDPCHDFYEFSCGRWEIYNPMPESEKRKTWTAGAAMAKKATHQIQQILEAPIESLDSIPMEKAKGFYSSCMDTATIEKQGVASLLAVLNSYGGWPSLTPYWKYWSPANFDMNKAIADGYRVFNNWIILSLEVTSAKIHGSRNTYEKRVSVTKPENFFIPHEALLNPEKYPLTLDAYKAYYVGVAKVLANATGASVTDKDLTAQVEDLIKFETRLLRLNESMSGSIDTDEARSTRRQYEGLKLDFGAYLQQLFSTTGVSVGDIRKDVEYLSNVTAILASTDTRTVANYFCWRVVAALAPFTTKVIVDLTYEFKNVINGAVKPAERSTTCVIFALNEFGEAVESKYVQNVLAPNTKASVNEMLEDIKATFQQNLEAALWMDEDTRKEVIKKLKAMRESIGYPDWILSPSRLQDHFEGLVLVPGDLFGSRLKFLSWFANKSLVKTQRSDPNVNEIFDPLGYRLSTTNAFYSHTDNWISIYAGILQPPFYRVNGPKSLNYGGIGTTVGHEIVHGFDLNGRWYDSSGEVSDRWTNNTWNKYWDKALCFIEQYSELSPEQDSVVEDEDSILASANEYIADNVGLRQAFFGYRKWIQERKRGKPEPRLPGLEVYSPEQTFFIGFANNYCQSSRTWNRGSELNVDYHTEGRSRVVIPLQNFDEFGLQWRCPAGSPMTPAADKKCKIWR